LLIEFILSIPDIYKPLDNLLTSHPHLTLANTLALDDREDTFSHNNKNGILIPAYSPEDIEETEDTHLLKLEHWLSKEEVATSPDVRKLKKRSIFKN